jgi:hypothetical protein
MELVATELLALPKSGKTTGPDHRVVLYSMLALVPPAFPISVTIVQMAVPLLAKETHEAASGTLASALPSHIRFLLCSETPLPVEATSMIAKETNSNKPATRRAFCSLIGASLWQHSNVQSAAYLGLAEAVLPSLESNLRAMSSNPLNPHAGPLDGYIATALMLAPLHRSGHFGTSRASPFDFIPLLTIFRCQFP